MGPDGSPRALNGVTASSAEADKIEVSATSEGPARSCSVPPSFRTTDKASGEFRVKSSFSGLKDFTQINPSHADVKLPQTPEVERRSIVGSTTHVIKKLFTHEWHKSRSWHPGDPVMAEMVSDLRSNPDEVTHSARTSDVERDTDSTCPESRKLVNLNEQTDGAFTNFTIFTEEGGPMTIPVVRFLSPFAVFWDRLRMVLAGWTLAVTPTRLAFHGLYEVLDDHPLVQALEVLCDVLFLLGVLLALVTSVGDSIVGCEYLRYTLVLRKRFSSPLFWCDLISCLPFVAVLLSGEPPPTMPETQGLRQLLLLKLLRIHWLFLTPASHFESKFWSRLQVARMLLWIVICTHLMACLWYAVVAANDTEGRHLEDIEHVSAASHYLLSLKYGSYMITGKPVHAYSDDELVLIAVSSAVGGIFFAFIYGNTTMLLTRMNIHLNRHHKRVATIESTIKNLNITPELRDRITRYHHFLALHHDVNAYSLVMQSLNMNLFVELKAQLFQKLFTSAPFLSTAPHAFLRRLLQVMVEVTFSPGDIVIREGDYGNEMYFVIKGKLDVLDKQKVQIGKIGESQYFGEVALMTSAPRLVTIRAATYLLLAMIQRDSFMPILEEFPGQKLKMVECMQKYPQIAKQLTRQFSGDKVSTGMERNADGTLTAESELYNINSDDSSSSSSSDDGSTSKRQHNSGCKHGVLASERSDADDGCDAKKPVPLTRRQSAAFALNEISKVFNRKSQTMELGPVRRMSQDLMSASPPAAPSPCIIVEPGSYTGATPGVIVEPGSAEPSLGGPTAPGIIVEPNHADAPRLAALSRRLVSRADELHTDLMRELSQAEDRITRRLEERVMVRLMDRLVHPVEALMAQLQIVQSQLANLAQ